MHDHNHKYEGNLNMDKADVKNESLEELMIVVDTQGIVIGNVEEAEDDTNEQPIRRNDNLRPSRKWIIVICSYYKMQ